MVKTLKTTSLHSQILIMSKALQMLRRSGEPGSLMFKVWDEKGLALTQAQYDDLRKRYPDAAAYIEIDEICYRNSGHSEHIRDLAKKALRRVVAGEKATTVYEELCKQIASQTESQQANNE